MMEAYANVPTPRRGLNRLGISNKRRATLVLALAMGAWVGPHGRALASPGANRCDLATATTVTPGPPGIPASFTLSGNNSSAGVCSISAAACALDSDCGVPQTCDGDCLGSFDRGYWEAITLTADARVTIHFCNTAPVRQGGDYSYLDTTCAAGTGACGGTTRADSAARADVCLINVGPYCPDVDCGPGNNNLSMTFDALPGSTTYYLPIHSANVCERTDPFTQSSIPCETDANCPVDRPCVSNRGPYSIRVLADELPVAACCLPNDTCEERTILSCEASGGTYLGPPNRFPAFSLCPGVSCDAGSCCTGEAGCKDSRETAGHVPMTRAICEAGPFNGSFVGGLLCKGGTCASGPDIGLSCSAPGDCALGAVCFGTPEQLTQINPCRLCTADPAYCHEPVTGFFRFFSDLDRGTQAADDFIANNSPITSVCWWGYYINDVGQNGTDCGPGPGDAFTITFYTDAGGFPGSTILSQTVLPTKLQARSDGNFKLYEYSATLAAPVAVTLGLKYWIEIVNNTTSSPAGCNWALKQSNGGNGYSVINLGGGYAPEDVYHGQGNADVAFCLNIGIGPDDGGDVLGACCTCPPSCADAKTRAQCNGVWHLGQTCAAVSCAPPSVDICTQAVPLVAASTPFRNTCANRDGPETVPTDTAPLTAAERDVWYTYYAASTNPTVTFDLCDVSFDAVIAVYSNGTPTCSCPTDNATLIAASDEGCSGAPYIAGGGIVTIPVTAGNCYLVRIAGYAGNSELGLGHIDVSQVGVPPAIIYVKAGASGLRNGTTWPNAFTNLREALALPLAIGTELWVARGTYMPDGGYIPFGGSRVPGSGDRSATFLLKSGMGVYGGCAGGENSRDLCDPFNNVTIASGDLNGDDVAVPCTNDGQCAALGGICFEGSCILRENIAENSYHVFTGSGTDATAILDGFTIMAANADGTNPDDRGGGMYNETGSPTMINCTISGNLALVGGGIVSSLSSNPRVSNCIFSGNRAVQGGALLNEGASGGVMSNCTFSANSADNGGGIYHASGNLTLSNCAFKGNSASNFGGGLINGGTLTVINCVFSGNHVSAGGGGGMATFSSSGPTVTNCTFSKNSASDFGGGIYNQFSSPTVSNCIVWENTDSGGSGETAQIHVASGTPTVNYSIVKGTWTGAGSYNIASDPLLVDADGADNIPGTEDDDLRLQAGSPAIDRGNNSALPADSIDLDGDSITLEPIPLDLAGNRRVLDDPLTLPSLAIVDMGSYEYFPDCNSNGIADGCDLDCGLAGGPCDVPGCGTATDCNTNLTPDSCDIAACGGDSACADCNLDHIPDGCQVASSPGCPGGGCVSGCLADVDQNCVPDACVAPTGTGGTTNWNDGTNWSLTGSFPDNVAGVPDLYVTLDHSLTLNVSVVINSLIVLSGVALNVTGGDLTITGAVVQIAGPITPPPKLRLSGSIVVSGSFDVLAPSSTMVIDPGGVLEPSAGVTDSSVTAAEVVIAGASCDAAQRGGELKLEDSMHLTVTGGLILDGSRSVCGSACPQTAGPITPPPKLRIGGDVASNIVSMLSVVGSVELTVDSSEPVLLGGDFDNRSVVPSLFDWTAGKLTLNGGGPQTFEVAGINLGQTTEGFLTGANAIFDNCPHTNFSLGTLEVPTGAHVTFVNRFANAAGVGCGEALYVHNLTFQSGATVTIDNCKVYYDTLTPNGVTPTFIGCGELLSTTPTPPPPPPPGDPHVTRSLELLMPPPSTAGPGSATALRVVPLELQNPQPSNFPCCPAHDFSSYEFAPTCTDPGGCARWVGKPATFYETQGPPLAGPYLAARLQCTPYYHDWTTDGLFYIIGAEVMPSSTYHVQQFAASCTGIESTCSAVSAPLPIKTARYGDVAERFNPPDPIPQPDAIDVSQSVDAVKHVLGAPGHVRAQMQPNLPDLNADINALDIAAVIDALKGFAYPFGGPCPCPSLATCGDLDCTSPSPCTSSALPGLGAGAMCVRTCSGGGNDSEPCINNSHCPGGCCGSGCTPSTVGGGHCRDLCGRCTP